MAVSRQPARKTIAPSKKAEAPSTFAIVCFNEGNITADFDTPGGFSITIRAIMIDTIANQPRMPELDADLVADAPATDSILLA